MLIELLCPKCSAPLELSDDMKVGTCPYCGCKAMVSESVPRKIEVDLPNLNIRNSEQLTEYALRMFMQGEKSAAAKAIDDALKQDPENTKAWILYSVMNRSLLNTGIREKLDLKKGRDFAKEILKIAPCSTTYIYPLYPDFRPAPDSDIVPELNWTDIQGGSTAEFKLFYSCKARKDDVIHYLNGSKSDLKLAPGDNCLLLSSGVHVFVNRITKKFLVLVVPDTDCGAPMYLSSARSDCFTAPGAFELKNWYSDLDSLVVHTYQATDDTKRKTIINCDGLADEVERLVNSH